MESNSVTQIFKENTGRGEGGQICGAFSGQQSL